MSKDIEPKIRIEDIEHVGKIELGEWGLEVKEQLTIKDWVDAVLSLQKFDGKVQWYLGDLAVYAESTVTGWGKSKYEELVAATGYEAQTFSQYAGVARRFPHEQREIFLKQLDAHLNISFNHFRVVSSLDDNFAYYWLQKANDNGWGYRKLKEEVIKWKESRGEAPEKAEKPIGYTSFSDRGKEFFKGYVPNLSQEEYDEKSWLLEVHDVIEERLHELGIEL